MATMKLTESRRDSISRQRHNDVSAMNMPQIMPRRDTCRSSPSHAVYTNYVPPILQRCRQHTIRTMIESIASTTSSGDQEIAVQTTQKQHIHSTSACTAPADPSESSLHVFSRNFQRSTARHQNVGRRPPSCAAGHDLAQAGKP